MPGYRPRRGGRPFSKGRTGKKGPVAEKQYVFKGSRLKETEDDASQDDARSEEDALIAAEEDQSREDKRELQSASEDEAPASNSYALLLQSLRAGKVNSEPPRKKRKVLRSEKNEDTNRSVTDEEPFEYRSAQEDAYEQPLELREEVEADEEHENGHVADADSENEEILLRDPFEKHYTTILEQDFKDAVSQVDQKQWLITSSTSDSGIRSTALFTKENPAQVSGLKSARDSHLKRRLVDGGTKIISSLSSDEKNIAGLVFNYIDIINGGRNVRNSMRLRDLSCLHALNHIFKTRDRVLKNNAKLSSLSTAEALDLRDQGFTRPKVLIVVPTKQACVRFVESIVKISEPDQQENKARFMETFSHEDGDEWQDKPEDFRQLFGGNHEEDFRIGLKFTRKTIKYFSGFYNSDIIIGSPLGLMRTITAGSGKDKKKPQDADFLSSIELVIVDHANALQMQNWQHVDHVFSQLNLLPKDSHGCDFSRVRHWYLDGQAKYLRQTIVFSDYLTPEINALASTHLHNVAGRLKLVPTYPGAMLSISSLALPFTSSVPQTFLRIPSPNPLSESDARFKFFATTILAPLVRDARHQRGILLFIPTYADFARLRNYLSTSSDTTALSFGSVSEYTPVKEVMRARSHFLSGRHALLLYSERAHHHFRYRIKGVRKILWYGVPENPIFWTEIIALLGHATDKKDGQVRAAKGGAKGVIRALFTKWDVLKLERIVGTERVGRLINDHGGDAFDFV
ncbi:uncharacterized protein A1O5_04779 [Cladophialophora psammophila CBS 110553]|uniref:U3 small nucleolar RNA-associated protein 25 n=1 Tax=Cladophialophora psammophila CBS 110553 TaxID=1182543 RepID=W9X4M1_9EURO|nr:uncharacterized protein A1O5_04779 [Cladophialophora psammophila CBS 110553]EXJ72275.1 hypothetical protein A1O5_04779 [Cladophialophora psammophila CBS 110553]